MGGAEGAAEILRIYLDLLPGRRDAVLGAGDSDARARAAHALRSPSALVGAGDLAARCRSIEARSREGGAVPEGELMAFAEECVRVATALEALAR
ncbi:MAG: Hpt domain-containing protein [Thermoleophilia bacterium]|nr:Hpt domain-containing protein [Thermoleophilia bacterium]